MRPPQVTETFLRCVKLRFDQTNAVIELNGLKIAEDRCVLKILSRRQRQQHGVVSLPDRSFPSVCSCPSVGGKLALCGVFQGKDVCKLSSAAYS